MDYHNLLLRSFVPVLFRSTDAPAIPAAGMHRVPIRAHIVSVKFLDPSNPSDGEALMCVSPLGGPLYRVDQPWPAAVVVQGGTRRSLQFYVPPEAAAASIM